MPEIKLLHILSVSNEDKQFPAENLIKNDSFKKWKCVSGEKQASVVFQFEKASEISQIDIGNESSAFIEVLVGKSTTKEDDYKVVVVTSSFMNPAESRASQNPNRVRIFNREQLSKAVAGEKWDRAKVVCTQPFNKSIQYGLSFIKFHSTPTDGSNGQSAAESVAKTTSFGAFKLKSDNESSSIRCGSLFEKNKTAAEATSSTTLSTTGPAAIRAASKVAEQLRTDTSVSKPFSSPAAPMKPVDTPSTSKPKEKVTKHHDTTSCPSPPPQKKVKIDNNSAMSSKLPSSSSSSSSSTTPLRSLMSKVVFVLSGFENPERSNLRDMAVDMGAEYKPDWTKGCTHLICAFANTPKFSQVLGKGRIVKKTWISDCYAQKKLLPWRQYRLGRAKSPDGQKSDDDAGDNMFNQSDAVAPVSSKPSNTSTSSVECIRDTSTTASTSSSTSDTRAAAQKNVDSQKTDDDWDPFADEIGIESDCDTEEEIRRFEALQSKNTGNGDNKTSNTSKKKKSDKQPVTSTSTAAEAAFDASTDDDEGTPSAKKPKLKMRNKVELDDDGLPILPDYFAGQTFLLSGKFTDRRALVRYIVAYNGRLVDYMDNNVKFVVTEDRWNDAFDEALAENSNLVFVRPKWLQECHKAQKCLPYQKYVVIAD